MAEGIRDAYDDLFQININAQTLSKSELINKFKTLSQGKLSDAVMDKMAMTFTELCKLGDFKSPSVQAPKVESAEKNKTEKGGEKQEKDHSFGKIAIDGLVYNIQIVLPESRDQAVYDVLFRSLREHLG